MTIRYLPEDLTKTLITRELALEATTAAYLAASDVHCESFPVVLGHGSDPQNRFSIKSAAAAHMAGVKIGSYWPRNFEANRPRHNSCIVLFDQSTGRIDALVEAGTANAYRTAAGNAIAVDLLARPDSRVLAVFGAGHQALYECDAVMRVRQIETICIVNRSVERSRELAKALQGRADVSLMSTEEACRSADVIVTVTGSRAPLFLAEWVKPGTHISCMGADARGKQEVPVQLLHKAELYCDLLSQSVAIGEFQHIAEDIERGLLKPCNIGGAMLDRVEPRNTASITVFDSSGLALQDIFLAQCLLREAERKEVVSFLRA